MLSHHCPPPSPLLSTLCPSLQSPPLPLRSHHLHQGWATVQFCLRGEGFTHTYKISLGRMTLFKSRYIREPLYGGFLAWLQYNGFIFSWVLNTTVALLAPFILQINAEWYSVMTQNCMQSQYSVRMPFLSINGVCVWDNTHKSWFLESSLMIDVLSVCLCALTCQENLEPVTCKDLMPFSSPCADVHAKEL